MQSETVNLAKDARFHEVQEKQYQKIHQNTHTPLTNENCIHRPIKNHEIKNNDNCTFKQKDFRISIVKGDSCKNGKYFVKMTP